MYAVVVYVGEADGKSRGDDDDDDDVFMSTEDAVNHPAAEKVDSKRRSQSLSALNSDNSSSQPSDVIVRSTVLHLPCLAIEYR